ncbi:hypothetical protein J8J40_26430, partial [Mycobacterium tuberculosis]|nr:hypothetical protein [Mycobacterium tuberculosis]
MTPRDPAARTADAARAAELPSAVTPNATPDAAAARPTSPAPQRGNGTRRRVLLIGGPLLVLLGVGYMWLSGGRYV